MRKSAVFLLVIAGFLIYTNSVSGKFIWDDYGLIIDNEQIKSWLNAPGIFQQSFGSSREGSIFYRPMQILAHMAGYSFWGLDARGYHLFSVFLHILVSLAAFMFIRLLLGEITIAFTAAFLFLAHPIQTEAVSYISGVSDPLAFLFMLLSLTAYLKALPSGNIRFYLLSVLSFILALLSKESAIALPFLILLYHYTYSASVDKKVFFLFAAVLLGYVTLRLLPSTSFIRAPLEFTGILLRIPNFFASVIEYLRLLIWPFGLHLGYEHPLFSFTDARVISGLLVFSSLLAAAFYVKKRSKVIFFSILWFFITLLPVSNIYPISYFFMMEHWLYVPSLGFFILVAYGLNRWGRKGAPRVILSRPKTLPFRARMDNGRSSIPPCGTSGFSPRGSIMKFIFIIVVAFYAYRTIQQNDYWYSPIDLYKRSITYNPRSWILYNELGLAYAENGDYPEAVRVYHKALEINPGLTGIRGNLRNALEAGKLSENRR